MPSLNIANAIVSIFLYQLTSTMAQEIEVKKLTNNIQAFPVAPVDTEHRQVKVNRDHMKLCYIGYIAAKISGMKPTISLIV